MTTEELAQKLAAIETELLALRSAMPVSPEQSTQIKQRLDELLRVAEEAQRKADDEARRAYLAKQMCEDHAKAITQLKGQADTEFAAVASQRANLDEIGAKMALVRSQADEAITAVYAAREVTAQVQASIQQFRPQIENDAKTISENRNLAETQTQEIRSATNEIKSRSEEVSKTTATASAALISINETKARADSATDLATKLSSEIQLRRSEVDTKVSEVEKIIQVLNKRDSDLADYKKKLEGKATEYDALYKKLGALLPHAASASLATAFRSQRRRFLLPQIGWLLVFVFSILLLVDVAAQDIGHKLPAWMQFQSENIPSLVSANGTKITWEDLLLQIVRRLPLMIPLVWVAIFAGRNYSMSLRMEEDYAYKEAVSVAFEGYKREMKEIAAVEGNVMSPLHTLCANVLTALAQRPGRIYEGKHQDVTPLTPIANAISNAALRDRQG